MVRWVCSPLGSTARPTMRRPRSFIPPIGTRSGVPMVQGESEGIFFNLFLPSGATPPKGWPVVIFGHGGTESKQGGAFLIADSLAAKGLATIAINMVGHGRGADGTLTVSTPSGPVTFPAGGRSVDLNNNGSIGASEGLNASPPHGIISNRDGFRQTVVDLMQLVRVIKAGVDIQGDGVPRLRILTHIYYTGVSWGGVYGTLFLAVEPLVRAGVPNVPGGPFLETNRLGMFRPGVGANLAARVPSLIRCRRHGVR